MTVLLLVMISLLLLVLYRRYIPVWGIGKINIDRVSSCNDKITIVDTRDYQISSQDMIDNACCLPMPYLHRYYNELPNHKLIIVAKDRVDKNLSSRFLRKKGKHVVGYHVAANE
ncbi:MULTISPECIES: sulfurtransferase [unclassified Virgibacillus]|uniref:sulfurtransferase n=1 Tax=unclassified Virgibacillus TaxID=2620237 RepID=UPI000EF489D8|nr:MULTISPECIES: sulfurtransferase [unclassified Virgibacillus]MDY7043105.1 sulfurtransferase [Virgibacillus sp. M23]